MATHACLIAGGTQALPEASAALRQTCEPDGGDYVESAQEAAQQSTTAYGRAVTAPQESSELPAFLSGQYVMLTHCVSDECQLPKNT